MLRGCFVCVYIDPRSLLKSHHDLYPSQDDDILDAPSDSLRILWDTSARRSLAAITKSAELPDQLDMKAKPQSLIMAVMYKDQAKG